MNDYCEERSYEEYQRKMKWLSHCFTLYTGNYLNNGLASGNFTFGTLLLTVPNMVFLSTHLEELLKEEEYDEKCIEEVSNPEEFVKKVLEYYNEFIKYSRKLFKNKTVFNQTKIMMAKYKGYVLELSKGKLPPIIEMKKELKKVWDNL